MFLWHALDLNLYTPIWEEEEAGCVLTRHSIGDCLVFDNGFLIV